MKVGDLRETAGGKVGAHAGVTVGLSLSKFGKVGGASPVLCDLWPFDESSGTDAANSIRPARNATWSAAVTWPAGKIGNAVTKAAGLHGVVNASINIPFVHPYTVMGWVNGASQESEAFFAQYDTAGNNRMLQLRSGLTANSAADKIRVLLSRDGIANEYDAYGTAVILDSTWHHVAVTLDTDGTVSVFVDGAADAMTGTVTTIATHKAVPAQALVFGRANETSSNDFVGSLDDWRYYTSALSQKDIAAIYNSA